MTFEAEEKASKHTIDTLSNYFESQGIDFFSNNGVAFKPDTKVYRGREGFRLFMDDVFEVADTVGGEICLFNARPANWIKWLKKDWYEKHSERMQKVLEEKGFNFRVTAQKGDYSFIGKKFVEYRWVPDKLFNQQSIYVYGNRMALMSFDEDAVEIFVIHKQEFADSFRAMFDHIWETVAEIPDVGEYKPENM